MTDINELYEEFKGCEIDYNCRPYKVVDVHAKWGINTIWFLLEGLRKPYGHVEISEGDFYYALNEKKKDDVIEKYMPRNGEGETKASQVVTAMNKLIYKWWNDGDVFDNTKGLKEGCNDLSSYANWLYIHTTENARAIMDTVYDCKNDDDYDVLLNNLGDELLLNTELLKEYEKMDKEGTIYKCNGMFKFEQPVDDEDDWY